MVAGNEVLGEGVGRVGRVPERIGLCEVDCLAFLAQNHWPWFAFRFGALFCLPHVEFHHAVVVRPWPGVVHVRPCVGQVVEHGAVLKTEEVVAWLDVLSQSAQYIVGVCLVGLCGVGVGWSILKVFKVRGPGSKYAL